jgi:RPC5 protein
MASLDYTSRIICSSPETDLNVFVGKDLGAATINNAYVHSLNYLPSSADNKASNSNSKNAKDSETMDVGAVCTRLVGLLHKGMPTPFSLLRRHFPSSVPDETMLVALGSCAFLIRGNLILQSRLLPLAPAIAQARTMILLILQTMGVVYRSRLEAMYNQQDDDDDEEDETSTGSLGRVSSEALLMLLEQVAQKTQDGWKLKVDDDVSFAERFPETVLMHLKFWGDEVRRCGALLDRYRSADI